MKSFRKTKRRNYLKNNESKQHTEDFVDWIIWRKRTVEYRKLSLQTFWNIFPPTARVYHGGKELNINDGCEISRFVEIVETTIAHELTNYLVGDLTEVMKSIYLK